MITDERERVAERVNGGEGGNAGAAAAAGVGAVAAAIAGLEYVGV